MDGYARPIRTDRVHRLKIVLRSLLAISMMGIIITMVLDLPEGSPGAAATTETSDRVTAFPLEN